MSSATSKSINSVKSKSGGILEDPEQVSYRWKEHFLELLNTTFSQDETVLDNLPEPPFISLHNDEPPPTSEEVSSVINKLRNGKSPGIDRIPPRMIKAGESVVVDVLTKLFKLIMESEKYLNDFHYSKIIALYKYKGDNLVFGNHHGISG